MNVSTSIYADDAAVARMTADLVSAGHSIFQIYKLADDDRQHVADLLRLFSPPDGGKVLDAGCGVGTVADIMSSLRPDLDFVLLNISPAQLSMCPDKFKSVCGDIDDLPIADEAFDGVMLNYSLGHGILERAISEAARILRRGGILFIYDIGAEDGARLFSDLKYMAHSIDRVRAVGHSCGLQEIWSGIPERTTLHGFVRATDRDYFARVFEGVFPVVYKFVKP